MVSCTLIVSELQNRINQAVKETEQKYQNAVEELGELKKKINDLELPSWTMQTQKQVKIRRDWILQWTSSSN